MIQEAIAALVVNEEVPTDVARQVAQEILNGDATACQIAAFITALRMRGEQVGHIQAFTEILRSKALHILPPEGVVLDTCGTGGDSSGTFNVSTTAAIIAAAAGVKVAKHGNRAVSSKCGSADVLAQLGVNISAPAPVVQRCLHEIGICFLFAPAYHSAMKHAVVPRREVGIRSIFNMIGPLSNPAGATHQLVGVYSPDLTETFAQVLQELGSVRALVVHGSDGIDEITTTSVTQISELKDGRIHTWTVSPNDFGIHPADLSALTVSTIENAAQKVRDVLAGVRDACADMALVNAGAALYLCDRASSMRDGYLLAEDTVKSGKATQKLDELVEMSNAQ